jgi:CBS domain-containing membrane protein
MKRNEPISHIMSSDVFSVHTAQKPSEVRKLLAEKSVHHVPVLNGKKLVGMISSTDMMKLSFSAYGSDERSVNAVLDDQFSIETIMQKNVTTIDEKDSVRNAAVKLQSGTFHSLPVINAESELVGIVTSTDLIRYLLDQY